MEGAAAAAVVEDAAAAADGHPQPAAAGVAAASDPGQEAEEDGLSGLMRGMVRRMLHRILARHAPDRGALLYGGVRQGRPVGAAAFYLHDRLVKGCPRLLTGVLVAGGGGIALQELQYAHAQGVPWTYVACRCRHRPYGGSTYGPVHAWATGAASAAAGDGGEKVACQGGAALAAAKPAAGPGEEPTTADRQRCDLTSPWEAVAATRGDKRGDGAGGI